MSASGVISNLSQALNCAGKCDCCAQLQAQINALEQRINNIQSADEESIIQRAVSRADAQIMPKVAGIALATVLAQISPWQAKFATLEGMSGDALSRARQALEKSYNAESVAGAASNAANGAASKAASALAQLAALAASIASILIAIGTLYALGSRIDAVENGLSQLGDDVSSILGRLLGIKQTAERADSNASNALNRADGAQSLASAANGRANIADSTANRATQEAGQAQATAEQAKQNARDARNVAERAQGSAQQAQTTADKAQGTAQQAQTTADKAQGTAQQAQTTADRAQGTAQQAQTTADKAQDTAQQAQTTADRAQGTADKAQGTAEKAFVEARKAREYVDKRVGDLRDETKNQIVPDGIWREVPPITIKLVGGIVDPLKQADRKLENDINQINQRYGDISKLSDVERIQRQTELELAKFKREADLNAKQSQGDLDLLRRRFDQTVKDFDDAWAAQRRGESSFNEALKRIENQRLPGIEGKQQQQDRDLDKINERLREQEEMNRDGARKLDQLVPTIGGIDRKLEQIIPTLGGIPLIPGRVIDGLKPSIPTVPQIKKATKDGVCEEFQGGGCAVNALNNNASNISNNINRNLGDKLDKVAQGFNTGANAAQLGLLNTINTKLGDQLPGGIGGKLERFSKWLHLDRVLNMMIWATTIHNAVMLSNDIGQTLLSAIGNVFQLFGLKDSEGKAFDLGSIISSSIENLIKGIIGADNYVQLREAWAKANRIYQATVNILNNFQNLASTILTALEMTAGKVAKIGNALRSAGEVLENAYGWMNPQPKYNRVTQTLESLQNGASTIQMVTQAPLDIIQATTELTNSATELTNAIKDDTQDSNKGKESPEPDKLKADKDASKAASAGKEITPSDLDPDD